MSKTINRSLFFIAGVLLATRLLNGQVSHACPDDIFSASSQAGANAMTARAIAPNAANFDLNKVLSFKKSPTWAGSLVNDLVIVGAHRGYWEYCPENSTEAFQAAMDAGVEEVEMDLRPSAPGRDLDGTLYPNGKLILVHDYDMRGEALLSDPGVQAEHRVFALSPQALANAPKVDRQGHISIDSHAVSVKQESFQDLLTSYFNRLQHLPGAVTSAPSSDTVACSGTPVTQIASRGSLLVLDLKGDDAVKKNGYTPFPELYAPGNNQMPAVNQGIASQYQTLLDGVQELHDFECRHNIDLSLAVAFKLQLSQMPAFSQFVSDLHSLPVPALVFIVYANNVDTSSTNPSSSDAGYNLYKLGQYQVQDRYIFTDWQLQWTNSALVSWIQSDLAQGAGVGGFLPSNAGPEGYRNSDGQCNNYRRQDVLYPSECNSFPVNSGQNASIEFTIPVGGPQQTMATYVLSDQFQNVIRYLQVIGKRNLSWIQ